MQRFLSEVVVLSCIWVCCEGIISVIIAQGIVNSDIPPVFKTVAK